MSNTTKLGTLLKAARKQKRLSLREVERQTDISNAYLSQVESGKIKSPAPTILHQLSHVYEIPYATLMEIAGHPLPSKSTLLMQNKIARRFSNVTENEADALLDYLQFLRSKKGSDM